MSSDNDLRYPLILRAGQLKAINDELIFVLGTPVFFVCDDLARPHPATTYGRLYDVVTGLYVVYKDCGMKIFKIYLDFCKKKTEEGLCRSKAVKAHINAVNNLRGALCHGELPDGQNVQYLLRNAGYYLGHGDTRKWPEFMSELTETQCDQILIKLIKDSDRLVSYLKTCAGQIAADNVKLQEWRAELVKEAFNPDKPQYGYQSRSYFDMRIASDLEKGLNQTRERKPYQDTLQDWLKAMKPKLLGGDIKDSKELYQTLLQALDELYNPSMLQPRRSSARFLMEDIH